MQGVFKATVLLFLVGPSQQKDEEAQKLFQRYEKKFEQTKDLSIVVKGEIVYRGTQGTEELRYSYAGSIKIKSGNKLFVKMTTGIGSAEAKTEVIKSDGKELIYGSGGTKEKYATKEGLFTFSVGMLNRWTWALTREKLQKLSADSKERKLPEPWDCFSISKLELGPSEKVGSVDATVLKYSLKCDDKEWQVKLWLDAKALLPVKRSVTLTANGIETTLTESYEQVSLEELADKEFSHE